MHVTLLKNFGMVAGGLTGNILDREVAEHLGNRRHTLRLHDPESTELLQRYRQAIQRLHV